MLPTATELLPGDVVLDGHGYGENPAIVVKAGRFTAGHSYVEFTDGRFITVPADHQFGRGPRPGESVDGLEDYDFARDARVA